MSAVDYEGTAHLSIVPQTPLGHFNLVARFLSVDAASAALARLRGDGHPPDGARLLGHLSDAVHTGSGLTEPDAKMLHAVMRDGAIGAALGGVLGWIIGTVAAAIPAMDEVVHAPASAETLVAGGIIGAIVGLTAGGLVGGEAGLDRSQAGSDTYDDQIADGIAVLGIHADGDGSAERIVQSLYASGALSVRRFTPGEETSV